MKIDLNFREIKILTSCLGDGNENYFPENPVISELRNKMQLICRTIEYEEGRKFIS